MVLAISILFLLYSCEYKRLGPSPARYELGNRIPKIGGPDDPDRNKPLKSHEAEPIAGTMERDSTRDPKEFSTGAANEPSIKKEPERSKSH